MSSKYNPESRSSRETLALAVMAKLEESGFKPETDRTDANEAVYSRVVHDTDGKIRVLVYTTIIPAPFGTVQVRPVGSDAIRVCAVYKGRGDKESGIVSETRTHRSGLIKDCVDRMYKRMRTVYGQARTGERCSCGAPKFRSSEGNLVCCDLHWLSDDDFNRPAPKRRRSPRRSR